MAPFSKSRPPGVEHVIYSFKGGNDGQYPYGKLVAVNGVLYGTTYQGGVDPGWGTVFKITTSGVEKVIYRFNAGNDGAHPWARSYAPQWNAVRHDVSRRCRRFRNRF